MCMNNFICKYFCECMCCFFLLHFSSDLVLSTNRWLYVYNSEIESSVCHFEPIFQRKLLWNRDWIERAVVETKIKIEFFCFIFAPQTITLSCLDFKKSYVEKRAQNDIHSISVYVRMWMSLAHWATKKRYARMEVNGKHIWPRAHIMTTVEKCVRKLRIEWHISVYILNVHGIFVI